MLFRRAMHNISDFNSARVFDISFGLMICAAQRRISF
jgi:hypothetical protein